MLKKNRAINIQKDSIGLPPMIQAVQAVRYWNLLLKRSKGGWVAQSTIDITHAAAGIPLIAPNLLDRPSIVRNLREAKAYKRSLEPHHSQLRENYLTKLAEAKVLQRAPYLSAPEYTQELQQRQDKEIKQLIYREKKKLQFKKIGRIMNPASNYGGLQRIDIPSADTL